MLGVRVLPGVVLFLATMGCSAPLTMREQGALGALVTPAPVLVASPMYVWVPQWGVYVVQGQDIVYHDGYYYYWYGGRWYVSRTHRGPWNYVTDRPPALIHLPAGHFDRHLPPGLEKTARPQPSRDRD